MSLLYDLIEEDFGIKGNNKWYRSIEKSSLVYNSEKDLFFYNAEDIYGDAYIYLTQVRKWNHDTAKEFLKDHNFSATFIQKIENGKEVIVYPKLVDVFHENIWSVDRSYFHNRTIEDETISRFKLGYYNRFFTIPIFQEGLLKQIQMRRDSPKLISNYYKDVGPLLFNVDVLKLVNKVYLTEGIIGSIILANYGSPSISMNVGCEAFQPTWITFFKNCKEIIILFDNDKAGNKGAIRTAKILGETRCKIYNFWDFDSVGYAVDDYFIDGNTKPDLLTLIKNNSKYSFELKVR